MIENGNCFILQSNCFNCFILINHFTNSVLKILLIKFRKKYFMNKKY